MLIRGFFNAGLRVFFCLLSGYLFLFFFLTPLTIGVFVFIFDFFIVTYPSGLFDVSGGVRMLCLTQFFSRACMV